MHHAMAFGFRYRSSFRGFEPVTRRLVVFERGCDDPDEAPWLNAGYSNGGAERRGLAAVEVTNAGPGGALVPLGQLGAIIGIGVAPPTVVRIVCNDVVRGSPETPAFPREGGLIDPELCAFVGAFVGAVKHGAYVEVLPPGAVVDGCTSYVDSLAAVSWDGEPGLWQPSSAFFLGRADGVERRNRLRFSFTAPVDCVLLPRGAREPEEGDFAVVDFDVRVRAAQVFPVADVAGEDGGAPDEGRQDERPV